MKYLQQHEGTHCFILALCNALRYFGKNSPEPRTEEYEYLIDLGGARNGACIHKKEVADYLGLNFELIDPDEITKENLPIILTAKMPEHGARHASLIIDVDENYLQIVNYNTYHGDVVMWVEKNSVKQTDEGWMPKGNINRWCSKVTLKETGLRELSGSVDSDRPLVNFLYILMRDHLPVGTVEEILKYHILNCKDKKSQFTNGWLAEYAKYVANNLKI